MKNKDLPAMPTTEDSGEPSQGLTKREYFAASAPDMPPHWLATFSYTEEEDELMMKEYGHTENCECARYTRALVAWRWHYADMMLEGEK